MWMMEALKVMFSPAVNEMRSVLLHPLRLLGQAANTALARHVIVGNSHMISSQELND